MRRTRLKMFIGSTVEEIEKAFNEFFGDSLCPGNLIKTTLQMHNGVYQYEVIYAEFLMIEHFAERLLPLSMEVAAETFKMPVEAKVG